MITFEVFYSVLGCRVLLAVTLFRGKKGVLLFTYKVQNCENNQLLWLSVIHHLSIPSPSDTSTSSTVSALPEALLFSGGSRGSPCSWGRSLRNCTCSCGSLWYSPVHFRGYCSMQASTISTLKVDLLLGDVCRVRYFTRIFHKVAHPLCWPPLVQRSLVQQK